jgi:hypothetical protein
MRFTTRKPTGTALMVIDDIVDNLPFIVRRDHRIVAAFARKVAAIEWAGYRSYSYESRFTVFIRRRRWLASGRTGGGEVIIVVMQLRHQVREGRPRFRRQLRPCGYADGAVRQVGPLRCITSRQAGVSHHYPIDESKGVYDLLQPTNTNINLVVRKVLYPV